MVDILSDILCSELIYHFREIFNVTLGVPNAAERSFFGDGRRDPCNLSGVQIARQLMKLNSFICLTHHLSDSVKVRLTFFSVTYTNEKFWFHLCYITLALMILQTKLCALF